MSLAETQQIMSMLKEIMEALDLVDAKTKKLNADLPKTKDALGTFRQLERVSLRYLTLVRQMGLPDDMEKGLQVVAKFIVLMQMLQMSMSMMTRGPFGVASSIAGFMMIASAAPNMLEGY